MVWEREKSWKKGRIWGNTLKLHSLIECQTDIQWRKKQKQKQNQSINLAIEVSLNLDSNIVSPLLSSNHLSLSVFCSSIGECYFV